MKNAITLLFLILAFQGLSQTHPKKVLITYYSASNNTKTLAEEVQKGARSVTGVEVVLKNIHDTKTSDLLEADAIIVGSPVYNANVAPEVISFIDKWPFEGYPLKNKIGAAFVTSGGMSAGEELVQANILHSMLIFGMIIVGGDDWQSALGASAITEEGPFNQKQMHSIFLKKGFGLGKRVAEITKRLN
jgi:NAD(P)H dehydrogenase (quinone)